TRRGTATIRCTASSGSTTTTASGGRHRAGTVSEMGVIASANWGLLPGYTVIGITLGGIYALAAIGLVLIYRVSGVLNFAQGAVSMFSAFVAYQVSTVMGAPAVVGLLAAIVVGGALGYVIERFTIRPLAGRSTLNKV